MKKGHVTIRHAYNNYHYFNTTLLKSQWQRFRQPLFHILRGSSKIDDLHNVRVKHKNISLSVIVW